MSTYNITHYRRKEILKHLSTRSLTLYTGLEHEYDLNHKVVTCIFCEDK